MRGGTPLLEAVPELESTGSAKRRLGIRGTPPDLTDVPAGCVFAPRCDYAQPSCDSVSMAIQPVGPDHGTACHLAETFLPSLRNSGVAADTIETITVENPRRWLTIAAPPQTPR